MALTISSKRLQVDKATRTMVLAVAVAVFITLFCIFSARSLTKVLSYQNRVASQQSIALDRLNKDISASQQLGTAYAKFNNSTGSNLLGQSVSGSGPNQGDNSKLILDALPSVNDYPAMVVSLQNLFANQGVAISSLSLTNTNSTTGGSSSGTTSGTTSPVPPGAGSATPIPLSFTAIGPLNNIENFINHISTSILPVQFLTVEYSGSQNNNVTMTVTAQVYFQAATKFNITTETVK